jgi:hypothetical protein
VTGSDRYDIHLHMERPILVKDLMQELEKKSRVAMTNQQILYRGKILSYESHWQIIGHVFEIYNSTWH